MHALSPLFGRFIDDPEIALRLPQKFVVFGPGLQGVWSERGLFLLQGLLLIFSDNLIFLFGFVVVV